MDIRLILMIIFRLIMCLNSINSNRMVIRTVSIVNPEKVAFSFLRTTTKIERKKKCI